MLLIFVVSKLEFDVGVLRIRWRDKVIRWMVDFLDWVYVYKRNI